MFQLCPSLDNWISGQLVLLRKTNHCMFPLYMFEGMGSGACWSNSWRWKWVHIRFRRVYLTRNTEDFPSNIRIHHAGPVRIRPLSSTREFNHLIYPAQDDIYRDQFFLVNIYSGVFFGCSFRVYCRFSDVFYKRNSFLLGSIARKIPISYRRKNSGLLTL